MSKQPPPAPTASTVGPCPTIIQISRTPRHWKFTQHLRTTRPSPVRVCVCLCVYLALMITGNSTRYIQRGIPSQNHFSIRKLVYKVEMFHYLAVFIFSVFFLLIIVSWIKGGGERRSGNNPLTVITLLLQIFSLSIYLKSLPIPMPDPLSSYRVRGQPIIYTVLIFFNSFCILLITVFFIGEYDELLTLVKKRKLRWFGHVSRSSGLAKTILQGTVKGKRKRGRQKKRWEDNIKEWTGMDFASSTRAAENRSRCKGIVANSSVVPRRPPKVMG